MAGQPDSAEGAEASRRRQDFPDLPNGTSYELWAWPGPEQAREWPRRLSQHLVLDEAKGGERSHGRCVGSFLMSSPRRYIDGHL